MIFIDIIRTNPCYPVFGVENIAGDVLCFVEKIVISGIKVLQLREKKLDTKSFIELAKEVVDICHKYDCLCIINDRVDIALAVNADGVHIGQSDMPYNMVRQLLKYNKIIGLSLDFKKDIEIANMLDVDYVAINGVFSSSTKDIDHHIWGIKGLEDARSISRHPIVAIGGINEENIHHISRLCDGFAISSDICCAPDPTVKINNLLKKFYL